MKSIPVTKEKMSKLNFWMGQHADLCSNETASKIAEQFKNDTGIKIGQTAILDYLKIHFPKVAKLPGGEANGGKILATLKDHEDRIKFLEEYIYKNS